MTDEQAKIELAEYRDAACRRLHTLCGTRADAPNWADIACLLREREELTRHAQGVLDWDGAKTAAEAICDYADSNLTMMDAVDMEIAGAARLYEAAKTLRDLFAPAVTSTECGEDK